MTTTQTTTQCFATRGEDGPVIEDLPETWKGFSLSTVMRALRDAFSPEEIVGADIRIEEWDGILFRVWTPSLHEDESGFGGDFFVAWTTGAWA